MYAHADTDDRRLLNSPLALSSRAMKWLLNWQNFRRFYLYVMTENVKSIIIRHRHVLLSEDVKNRYNINEHDVIAAATLPELDDAYTRYKPTPLTPQRI